MKRLKFEENLYLNYVRDGTCITHKVTVDEFLLYFACGSSILTVRNNQPACWDSTGLGTCLPWWKFPGEIAFHAHRSVPRYFPGRSLSENPRNSLLKAYDTPYVCRIVRDQPPYRYIILPCDSLPPPQKKSVVEFLKDFNAAFPTSPSWSSNFTSCVNCLI